MMSERREKFFNQTVSEFIRGLVSEIDHDGVAFAVVVGSGRDDFEISGDELIDFVRRSIAALLEHGAKPVVGGGGTRYYWIEQPQYGSTTPEIVDNVIAEWLANGDPDHGGLWFASPRFQAIGRSTE